MSRKLDFSRPIFVIQYCNDCKNHMWNTRHDAEKYASFADNLAYFIKKRVPEATILFNQIPKRWQDKEIYFNLVWNDDENNDVFDVTPKIGAFEVSTVAYGEISAEKRTTKKGKKKAKQVTKIPVEETLLIYSKLSAKMWPLINKLGEKIVNYCKEISVA